VRRAPRNIEIFSMSVLDMFASALGAFILIAIILFPFYNQHKQLEKTNADIEKTSRELRRATDEMRRHEEASERQKEELRHVARTQGQLQQCRRQETACKLSLGTTFLVIAIEWDERCDIDLYVNDPFGNEFSYKKKNEGGNQFSNSTARLSLDMTDGPGIEVWQNPKANAGTYKLLYDVYSCRGAETVQIRGWVIDRSGGKRNLPVRALRPTDRNVAIASLRVRSDGSTTIEPSH
jgi:hypothetical protein